MAAEFQPSANLPGPPATPLTNAVLAHGEGTPFDDMATVIRSAPRSMTERQAGFRLLSVPQTQPGAGIMHSTPIRRGVFAVTPEGPDSVTTAATPHTWSGAQRMTEYGQLPTPYAANAAPGSSTRAPYSMTSSSRPADTPLQENREPHQVRPPSGRGHAGGHLGGQRSDVPDWRHPQRRQTDERGQPHQPDRHVSDLLTDERHRLSATFSAGADPVSRPASASLPGIEREMTGGGTGGRDIHTHITHQASTGLTSTSMESPISMLNHATAAARTPPAPTSSTITEAIDSSRPPPSTPGVTAAARQQFEDLARSFQDQFVSSSLPTFDSLRMPPDPAAVHFQPAPAFYAGQSVSYATHPYPTASPESKPWPETHEPPPTSSPSCPMPPGPPVQPTRSATPAEQSVSQIPVRYQDSLPDSGVMPAPARESRRQRRRQRLDQYWGASGQPMWSRAGHSYPAPPYPALAQPSPAHHLAPWRAAAGAMPAAGFPVPLPQPAVITDSVPFDDPATAIRQLALRFNEFMLKYPTAGSPTPAPALPAGALSEHPKTPSSDPDGFSSTSSKSESLPAPTPERTTPSPPASSQPSHDEESPTVSVLLWTTKGESFWLTSRSTGVVIDLGEEVRHRFRLPSTRQSGTSSDLDVVWSTLHHVGLNIQDLAAHGSVRVPERLDVDEGATYALLITRAQVTAARKVADQRGGQQRRLPMFAWATIPDTALESDTAEFDPVGLQAWAALIAAEAYLFRGAPSSALATPTCQSVRPRNSYPDGLLNPHTIPTRLWQVVSVDFVTGLPVTARNHDAFATFTCKLSKMVHIVPMNFQDSSAEVVARMYFDHIWKYHGTPMKIVSDPRFQDAMWKELMRLMGVKVASTTPYNPRSDRQAEHTNRVVEDMLRSFVGSNPEDWDQWCTNVEFAINDTRSDVTGFTPFELVLGHSPMSQLDLFLQAAKGNSAQRKGGEGSAHEMASRFAAQLEDARVKLELAQQRQRAQFDQRHVQQGFQIGDLVWVEAKHLTENIMNRE
ncbi:hypothetical protein CYMTET_39538 [Cymbomonas tetramitiformis]|uniref:Integrase catalytic domain-containing protein n=1 Tax=Cymbomonas tetramitiformis TaxID=36881 RepID=A0AAE0CAX5_9CHLO|nr:hypothetical protein CYMTET_39538 [Cymbomonas tetramitiformis]